MNKKMKRAAAIMASAVLCLSMSMSVFAASPDTGNLPDSKPPAQTEVEKELYQLWSGEGIYDQWHRRLGCRIRGTWHG